MTTKEQQTIDNLLKAIKDLKEENAKFREDVKSQVQAISTKTDKKHLPIILEQDILRTAQTAMNESIQKVLTDYNSPLKKLVESVISENSAFLKQLISESFNTVMKTDDFKKSIINAFSHKIARNIISNNDGLFDKVSNELKQDAVFKSKMALAVSTVVEECLNPVCSFPISKVIFFEIKNGKYIAKGGTEIPIDFIMKNEHYIFSDNGYVII